MAIKGGGKRDAVDGLFDNARKLGAVEGTEQDLQPKGNKAFTGTARSLSMRNKPPEETQSRAEASHTITFYENRVRIEGLHVC